MADLDARTLDKVAEFLRKMTEATRDTNIEVDASCGMLNLRRADGGSEFVGYLNRGDDEYTFRAPDGC